jgi:peptide/nickel transport system substrate-binding protein/oligopeptide transport system substrate-binding protein
MISTVVGWVGRKKAMRIPLGHTTSERDRRHGRPRGRQGLLTGLIAVMGLVPLLLAACGPAASGAASPDPNGVFVYPYYPSVPMDADHPNYLHHDEVFDPAANAYLTDANTISMLFTNLVTFDSALNVVPDAIDHMPDVDKTGTVYTFHLRQNMKFSDGQPIQAQDFAYSIDRSLDAHICDVLDAKTYGPNATGACGTTAGPGSYYLAYIKGAGARASGAISTVIGPAGDPKAGLSVVDPLTLQIRLEAPYAFFLNALTYPTSSVVEKSFVEKKGYEGGLWVDHLDQGGCSGPFQVESYGEGKQLTLVPNPNWEAAWGKKIQLRAVERPIVTGKTESYASYRAGKYDYSELEATEYSRARGQGDFVEIPSLTTQYFGLNFRLPPFNNLQVRQALNLALNKQYMVDSIVDGAAIPTNHIIPKGMPGYNPDLKNPVDKTESISGNQTVAVQLMKQARDTCQGQPEQQPDYCPYIRETDPQEIDLYANVKAGTRVAIGKAAKDAWNQILGLNIVMKPVSGAVVNQIFNRDPNNAAISANPFQIWMIGWIADYPDPQDWTTLQFQTSSGYNTGSWGSAKLDSQMAAADKEPDPSKRIGMYAPIEQQIIDSCAWIPYEQDKLFWRIRTWVRGFYLNPEGLVPDISWPNIYVLNHG